MSVTRINKFQAHEGGGDVLRDHLKSLVEVIESLEGCLSCQLLQSQENPAHMMIIEIWDSVDAHQMSLLMTPADEFEQTMSLLAVPPSGEYYDYCHV